jgi:hypothetical protein
MFDLLLRRDQCGLFFFSQFLNLLVSLSRFLLSFLDISLLSGISPQPPLFSPRELFRVSRAAEFACMYTFHIQRFDFQRARGPPRLLCHQR